MLKNIEIKSKNIEIAGLHEQVDKLEAEKTGWEEKFSKTESAWKHYEIWLCERYLLLWSY